MPRAYSESAMTTDVEIRRKDDHLHLVCQGEPALRPILRAFQNAVSLAEEYGLHVVLIDILDLEGPSPGPVERFQFGRVIARLLSRSGSGICVVFVGLPPASNPARLAERGARVRGARVEDFPTLDEARQWIREYTEGAK